MADLTPNINRLRKSYVNTGMLREKDLEKEETYQKYASKVNILMAIPISLQVYQCMLINKAESLGRYNTVRQLKWFSLVAALGLGLNEMFELNKKWQYLDRLYPEQTAYQKSFTEQAELFKINQGMDKNVPDKKELLPRERSTYRKMYSLGPSPGYQGEKNHLPNDMKYEDE